jgi:hypothetical protein
MPWNEGKLLGQKPPLKLKEIWRFAAPILAGPTAWACKTSIPMDLTILQWAPAGAYPSGFTPTPEHVSREQGAPGYSRRTLRASTEIPRVYLALKRESIETAPP